MRCYKGDEKKRVGVGVPNGSHIIPLAAYANKQQTAINIKGACTFHSLYSNLVVLKSINAVDRCGAVQQKCVHWSLQCPEHPAQPPSALSQAHGHMSPK